MSPSATPATQDEGGCQQVPRLPRKVPRRHARLNRAQARHPVPWVPRLPCKTKADASKCHDKVVCESWYVTKCVPGLPRKVPRCDGMWQRGVWSYVCDRWYVTKLCVKLYVTDGMWQSCVLSLCVCEVYVCERWYATKLCVKLCVKFMYVTDGMWQSCGLSLCVCEVYVCDRWYVTKLCVKFMYVTDSMWQSCVLSLCVCEVIVCVTMCKMVCDKVCVKLLYVKDGMWQR